MTQTPAGQTALSRGCRRGFAYKRSPSGEKETPRRRPSRCAAATPATCRAASSPRLGGARLAAPFLDSTTAIPAVSRGLASVLGETPDYQQGGLWAAALGR